MQKQCQASEPIPALCTLRKFPGSQSIGLGQNLTVATSLTPLEM